MKSWSHPDQHTHSWSTVPTHGWRQNYGLAHALSGHATLQYLDSGFGSKAVDIAAGVGTAYALGKSSKDTVAIGLAGLALGFVGDAMVKDVMYIMVTDLQIRERPSYGEVVVQTKESNLAQGSSTTVQQYVESAEVQWKTYHTRIVSTANKVNLEFQDAKPLLEVELSRSISGIF